MEVVIMALNNTVATIQAEYILKKIEDLNLNREAKEKLLDEIINTIKTSYCDNISDAV